MGNEVKNVPELRFPGFTSQYLTSKLGDKLTVRRGGSPRPIQKYLTTKKDGINWIKIGDVSKESNIITKTEEKIVTEGAKKSCRVTSGDLLLSNSMSFGRPYILEIDGCIHDGWLVIRDQQQYFNKRYLCYLLDSDVSKRQYKSMAAGGVINNLNSALVQNLLIKFPTMDEQDRIANFLYIIDQQIANLEKKIGLLKLRKESYRDRIFNQSCRTPICLDKDHNEWCEFRLSDVLTEVKQFEEKDKGIPHATLSKNGISLKTDRYDRDFLVTTEDKKYKVTHFNDICYNPANLKFGVICRNNFGTVIFSPIYVTLKVNNKHDPTFLGYFLTRASFINEIRMFEEGTVYERMAVKPSDFLTYTTKLPNLAEQKKIGSFFVFIDSQIAINEKRVAQIKKLKSLLMKKMFI